MDALRRELALALVAALVLLPLVEAKGGYGGTGGRRGACTPSDTNGDGFVSESERAQQCSNDGGGWVVGGVFLGVVVGAGFLFRKLAGG